MTNAQLLLAISIPSLLVLFGILMNRQDATAIRVEIDALRAELRAEINALRAEFKADSNALRAEIKADSNALRAEIIVMRDNIHADMIGIHERTTKLEARLGS